MKLRCLVLSGLAIISNVAVLSRLTVSSSFFIMTAATAILFMVVILPRVDESVKYSAFAVDYATRASFSDAHENSEMLYVTNETLVYLRSLESHAKYEYVMHWISYSHGLLLCTAG